MINKQFLFYTQNVSLA